MVSTGEPAKCEIVAPVVESTAVRSKTRETGVNPAGTVLDEETETVVALTTRPGPNVTTAPPSTLPALPPLEGSIVLPFGGERPLPGTAAGSGGVVLTPDGDCGAVVVSPVPLEVEVAVSVPLPDELVPWGVTAAGEPSPEPPPDTAVVVVLGVVLVTVAVAGVVRPLVSAAIVLPDVVPVVAAVGSVPLAEGRVSV